MLTRREVLATAASWGLVPEPPRWTAAWDRAIIAAAVERLGAASPASAEYALMLLESGNFERAGTILDRALEERQPEGSPLVLIAYRHGARLAPVLRRRVRDAIRRAAGAVRRTDDPGLPGGFVTLAAAELLEDGDLKRYASDHLIRFAHTIEQAGGFAEYNSPEYAHDVIAAAVRIRMFVKDQQALALARRIERRAWLHLGRRWHAPTEQLAGPMSRCADTDIGRPAWLQKALGGAVPLLEFDEIPSAEAPGEVAILDYRCPDDVSGPFLSLGVARQQRDRFVTAPPGVLPVHGTTWMELEFCLGSVNRGGFWSQSRPLLAYWGGPDRPARYLRARVLKDDHDFASALLYSAQEKNYLLGLVTFRNPGGDRHPLDPIKDGRFTCSRLRLRFDLAGAPLNSPMLVNGEPVDEGEFPPGSRVALYVGGTYIWLRSLHARCSELAGRLTIAREDGLLTISIDFLRTREPRVIQWPQTANAVFALALREPDVRSLAAHDQELAGRALNASSQDILVRPEWNTPVGALGLQAVTLVSDIAGLDRAFRQTLDGKPLPVENLGLD